MVTKGNREILFSPCNLGSSTASNRLVAQPMERSASTPDGLPTPELVKEYVTLASGKWGILVLEAMTVSRKNKSRRGQLVIDNISKNHLAKMLEKMRKVAPRTKFIIQITFPGIITGEGLEKTTILPGIHEQDPSIRLLSDEEIRDIQSRFKQAIEISIEIGADGIDIKGCHGYLVVEFLRPMNTRSGPFGGSFQNRVRFFKDLFTHAKETARATGRDDFLVGSRVSVTECMKGGFGTAGPDEYIEDLTEPLDYASLLEEWGADFMNVSAGIPAMMPEVTRPSKEVPWGIYNHFRLAKAVKNHLNQRRGTMSVIGSAYTMLGKDLISVAAKNIRDGAVDFVGLGRQTLADPLYPRKVKELKDDKIQYCVGCNLCAKLLGRQQHVGCVHHDEKFKKILKRGNKNE